MIDDGDTLRTPQRGRQTSSGNGKSAGRTGSMPPQSSARKYEQQDSAARPMGDDTNVLASADGARGASADTSRSASANGPKTTGTIGNAGRKKLNIRVTSVRMKNKQPAPTEPMSTSAGHRALLPPPMRIDTEDNATSDEAAESKPSQLQVQGDVRSGLPRAYPTDAVQ